MRILTRTKRLAGVALAFALACSAFAGAARVAALLWLVAVVAVYLAVREFGLALVH